MRPPPHLATDAPRASSGAAPPAQVTPISTDGSFTPQRALPVLAEWREAIEGCGFVRDTRARTCTAHCLSFRAAPRDATAPLRPMRIAFDARVTNGREPAERV